MNDLGFKERRKRDEEESDLWRKVNKEKTVRFFFCIHGEGKIDGEVSQLR